MAVHAETTQAGAGRIRSSASFTGLMARVNFMPYVVITAAHLLVAVIFLGSVSSGEQAWFERLPLDDAWTSLIYARSFAENLQFAYTSGVPESGMTSPLWSVLIGAVWLVLDPFGVSLPVTAKILGLGLSLASAFMVMGLVKRLTGQPRLGLFAGLILAVEPNFVFAAISGTEVALFSAVSLAASWAYLAGRVRTAGLLFPLVVLSRPEGFAIFGVAVMAMAVRRIWQRDRLEVVNRQDVQEAVQLTLPTLIVAVAWGVYNLSINGTVFPNAYLVRHQDQGLIPLGNLVDVLRGYFHHAAFFSGLVWPVTGATVILGGWALLRAHRFSAAPLVFFPVALAYAVGVAIPLPGEAWNFFLRRYLDPSMPFLVILLVTGMVVAWRQFNVWRATRAPEDPREAHVFNFGLNVIFVFIVALPFTAFFATLPQRASDYSWNTRNVNEVNVAMARWVSDNTPADARIGVTAPGAVGFFTDRHLYDLSGANTSEAIGRPVLNYADDIRIDYLVAFSSIYFDSWPVATEGTTISTERNTILGGSDMRAYVANWDQEVVYADKTLPYQTDIHNLGLAVIDLIDPGNPDAVAAQSEASHGYRLVGAGSTVNREFRTVQADIIKDEATTFTVSERFVVSSIPAERLVIVKRYDAALRGQLRVFADGNEVGIWDLPRRDYFFGEDVFTIPGSFITANSTELLFEVIRGEGIADGNSYFYWFLVDEDAVLGSPANAG